ncbi:YceI family protein [Thalassotalea sp. M1531]|uniref:YceI family protein n=1 Tax=Thalassotalea algicola TaxID=2716224 RepID=A0A7Y0L9G9_9GAMM|nr:YceI family protein [Thalassotalea algicola]NMP30418.1 YceI family protein [Thalassotalea algicola]
MMKFKALVLSSLIAFPAFSAWQLDNTNSTVNFISTKKSEVSEVHHFEKLMGEIGDNGTVTLAIDLASVNTNIEIRDQRMRDFLFNTAEFTKATFSADVDLAFIKAMAVGEQKVIPLSGVIDLHGKQQKVDVKVQVVKLAANRILVNSFKPLLLNAKQFDLAAGVAKLQEIAQLPSISNAVPVTFSLTYVDK